MALVTPQQLENASTDSNTISAVTNGDENTTVTSRLGRVLPTLARFFKLFNDQVSAALASALASIRSFPFTGVWVTGTSYNLRDVVLHGNIYYSAGVAHIAGGFDTDLAAGKWMVHQTQPSAVSIYDLGGAGDYDPATGLGTNNFPMALAYTEVFNDGPTIHCPFVTGSTNVYHFAADPPHTFTADQLTLTSDPGVEMHLSGVSFDTETDRCIKLLSSGDIITTHSYKDAGDHAFPQDLGKKTRAWITQGDLNSVRTRRVSPIAEFKPYLMNWPGALDIGGTDLALNRVAPSITLDETKIAFTTGGPTNAWEGAGIRLLVGQRISGRFVKTGENVRCAVFARTARGYFGISSSGTGTYAVYEKEAGKVQVQADLMKAHDAYRTTHPAFNMDTAIVTAVPLNSDTIQILVNGASFYSRRTPDPIQEIVYGGFVAGANTGSHWTDFALEEGAAQNVTQLVSWFVVGDSRQADGAHCPARYALEYIDGSMGARVIDYNNQAVAGHNSFEQLYILRANGVPPGTTHMLIGLITNDANNPSINPIDSYNNYIEMIDMGLAAGAKVILDIPPLWYSQTLAGPRGQTVGDNADRASIMRMVVMQAAADRGVVTVDMLSEPGLLIANFVNPLQVPNLTRHDSVLEDNIHGNPTLGKIQGFAQSKAALGQDNKVSTNRVDWRVLPDTWIPQSAWSYATGGPRKFRVSDAGESEFRILFNIGASRADETIVHSFGRLLSPVDPIEIPVFTELHERGSAVLDESGYLRTYGLAGSTGTKLRVSSGLYSTTY